MEENYDVMLMKYAIRVDACDTDELEGMIAAATGKFVDEIFC